VERVGERGVAVTDQHNGVRPSRWKAFLGPLARVVLAAVLVVGAVAAAHRLLLTAQRAYASMHVCYLSFLSSRLR
jgi:hypothetical protein